MPVYNEADTLENIVNRILSVELPLDVQIVATDDASTDGTFDALQALAERNPGKIIIERHEHNRGKGAAVSTCMRRAEGDILIIQDADLEYDPADYPKVLSPIISGQADVVYGARFTEGRPDGSARLLYLGNRSLTIMFNCLYWTSLNDMETCYKCFRREVVEGIEIFSSRFGIEPELTAKIVRRGYSIAQVPVSYTPRGYGEGKKITAWDGAKAVAAMLWFRIF